MKIRFSIRSVLLFTGLAAFFAALVGILLNEFGPAIAVICLGYFGAIFFVAVLLFGRTMVRNVKSFLSVWREVTLDRDRPDELKNKSRHPLD